MQSTTGGSRLEWSKQALDRRKFLRLGAAVALVPCIASAQEEAQGPATIPHWQTQFRLVVPNIYAFIREGGPGIDNASLSNAGLIIGPDNCMLIDSLGPPIHAKELRAAVLRTTDKARDPDCPYASSSRPHEW
jgi:hypothetical protein